jgi:hypothetical protein
MAGYSHRPLAAKLGIRPDTAIAILSAPATYDRVLGPLPKTVRRRTRATGPLDLVHVFVTSRRAFERRIASLKRALVPAGALWVSWPKRASGVATDLTEDAVRAVGLAHGLVDVKVCAVDTTWSGLKFVRRLRDR